MLRFLLVRVLQSIPVLFVMSLITFVIINAPPGRLRRLHPHQHDHPGQRELRRRRRRRRALPRGARAERPADGAVLPLDRRHRHPRRLRLVLLLQPPGGRGGRRAAAAHHRAGADLPPARLGLRHRLRHPRRHPAVQLDRHRALVRLLPRDDDPALPARADHPLRPRLQAERAGDRQLLLVAVRRRALELGQVRQPRPAHLAGGLRRDARRARLQHAGDARRTCSTR